MAKWKWMPASYLRSFVILIIVSSFDISTFLIRHFAHPCHPGDLSASAYTRRRIHGFVKFMSIGGDIPSKKNFKKSSKKGLSAF